MKRALTIRPVSAAVFFLGIWAAGAASGLGVEISVDLTPELDQFGSQIATFQIYDDGLGHLASAFGIYDTGASVVTWSAYDQDLSPLPIKVVGGAGAEGIGGTLTGNVSQPGQILVGGMQAVDFLTLNYDPTKVAFAPGNPEEHGIQLLVGTWAGSADLPTITGTPIHNGRLASNPTAPNGIAAKINMQWGLDLGALVTELLGGSDPMGLEELFQGVIWTMPDIQFVAPNTKLQAIPNDPATPLIDESTTQPVRIPLASYGVDNHADPGETITVSYNPFQNTGVVLSQGGVTLGDDPSHRLAMLFDTGASLSIISTQMAANLGLNLSAPEYQIDVQGAAGSVGTIPGFTIDSLELPVDDNGDGVADGKVTFTHVPVFVYDVTPADTDPAEGLDGILGMNLFNYASEMVYDPFDPLGPSLSLTFLKNPYQEDIDPDLLGDLQALGLPLPQWAQSIGIPGVRGGPVVPEPSALVLIATGGLLLLVWQLRRRAT